MTTIELPDKYRNMYIHRKNKDVIEVETAINNTSLIVVRTIFRNNNGLAGEELSDGIFSKDQLPVITSHLLKDTVNTSNYLSKNGYKGVTIIKQTKNGIKFG